MTITDIEQVIGDDKKTPLTLVLESGQQLTLAPERFARTDDGSRLFIPLGDSHYAIVETQSVKTILK